MIPGNYMTIMIEHIMSKIYAVVLDAVLDEFARSHGLKVDEQAGFGLEQLTLDHILTLKSVIQEARATRQRVYCCFVDFHKAFDTVLHAYLFKR